MKGNMRMQKRGNKYSTQCIDWKQRVTVYSPPHLRVQSFFSLTEFMALRQ